ncbi:hypothetical protein DZF91_02420 [Actinomadura logoneensis]|uniref:Uncharacterized protein n=1 Tax=Actinomadura logoneensis TaxID=2293572 RepID=A0A372JT52_9ACTN|nr:hypothetical protein DZF91_02420 [Actinomadura logoneensis]
MPPCARFPPADGPDAAGAAGAPGFLAPAAEPAAEPWDEPGFDAALDPGFEAGAGRDASPGRPGAVAASDGLTAARPVAVDAGVAVALGDAFRWRPPGGRGAR